jgi:hypothetical protein
LSRRVANEGTRDTTQAGQDNEPNHGQWQPDLHASDHGSVAAKEYAKHESPGDDLNHGQSQKALHDSGNGSGAAKGHAKHEAPGDDLKHGQSQKALHDSDNDSGAAKGHAKHEAPGDDLKHGQSQKALHDSDDAKSPVGTELGDSFHFKNGANNASSDILDLQQLGHGSGKAHEDGQHAAAHNGPVSVQDADAIDTSAAQHDHLGHSNHYAAHDLIV